MNIIRMCVTTSKFGKKTSANLLRIKMSKKKTIFFRKFWKANEFAFTSYESHLWNVLRPFLSACDQSPWVLRSMHRPSIPALENKRMRDATWPLLTIIFCSSGFRHLIARLTWNFVSWNQWIYLPWDQLKSVTLMCKNVNERDDFESTISLVLWGYFENFGIQAVC